MNNFSLPHSPVANTAAFAGAQQSGFTSPWAKAIKAFRDVSRMLYCSDKSSICQNMEQSQDPVTTFIFPLYGVISGDGG